MTVSKRTSVLPLSLPPRGLSREQAAAYIGVSPGFFDGMVNSGVMPKGKRFSGRVLFDRLELDAAFSALPGGEEATNNPWDGQGVP